MSQEGDIKLFIDWNNLGDWKIPEEFSISTEAKNPLCGDDIILFLKSREEGFQLIGMNGNSCSICKASAGLLFARMEIWTKDKFMKSMNEWNQILDSMESNSNAKDFTFWNKIRSYPGRLRCAKLPWTALEKVFI